MSKIIAPPDGTGINNSKYKNQVPGFWENLANWFWSHLPTVFKVWKKHKLVDSNPDENSTNLDLENYANAEDIKEYFD